MRPKNGYSYLPKLGDFGDCRGETALFRQLPGNGRRTGRRWGLGRGRSRVSAAPVRSLSVDRTVDRAASPHTRIGLTMSLAVFASFCGVDVSQRQLDVHLLPEGTGTSFAHTAAGIGRLVAWLASQERPLLVVEATGGLERALVAALGRAGIATPWSIRARSATSPAPPASWPRPTGWTPGSWRGSRSPCGRSRACPAARPTLCWSAWSCGDASWWCCATPSAVVAGASASRPVSLAGQPSGLAHRGDRGDRGGDRDPDRGPCRDAAARRLADLRTGPGRPDRGQPAGPAAGARPARRQGDRELGRCRPVCPRQRADARPPDDLASCWSSSALCSPKVRHGVWRSQLDSFKDSR